MEQMTKHLKARMSQRGISGDMVELARSYGAIDNDKVVLGRNELKLLLDELRRMVRVTLKALDKGGVVVVESDGALITTYNRDSFDRRRTHDR
jgi:hypothetical protein